jgi:hypothetical protein
MKLIHWYLPPALHAVPADPSGLLVPSARWAREQMAVQSMLPTAASYFFFKRSVIEDIFLFSPSS